MFDWHALYIAGRLRRRLALRQQRMLLRAGDHDVCVGRVVACGAPGAGPPLIFAGGAYLSISAHPGSSYR